MKENKYVRGGLFFVTSLGYLPFLFVAFLSANNVRADQVQTLSQQLDAMKTSSKDASTCDEKEARLQTKVAAKIDSHFKNDFSKLPELAKKKFKKKYNFTAMRPITILNPKRTQKPKIDKFVFAKVDDESWGIIDRQLRWYNFPTRNWFKIYQNTSSILMDDGDRRDEEQSNQISPADLPQLKKAYEEFMKCYGHSACIDPHFSFESLSFMKTQPALEPILSFLAQPLGERNYTAFLKLNDVWLEAYGTDIFPWATPWISWIGDHTLLVEMDAGDLTGHEAEFEKIISPWNADGLKIKIHWTKKIDSLAPLGVMKIFVDLRPGDRSYVDTDEKAEMHLSPFEVQSTIVHEMGHVLGLPDEYYPYFDAKNCKYRYLSNGANIMSDSYTGTVLPSHIQTLKILHFSNTDRINY